MTSTSSPPELPAPAGHSEMTFLRQLVKEGDLALRDDPRADGLRALARAGARIWNVSRSWGLPVISRRVQIVEFLPALGSTARVEGPQRAPPSATCWGSRTRMRSRSAERFLSERGRAARHRRGHRERAARGGSSRTLLTGATAGVVAVVRGATGPGPAAGTPPRPSATRPADERLAKRIDQRARRRRPRRAGMQEPLDVVERRRQGEGSTAAVGAVAGGAGGAGAAGGTGDWS